METGDRMRQTMVKKDPYPLPRNTGFPPISLRANLISALKMHNTAEMELSVKKIMKRIQYRTVESATDHLTEGKEKLRSMFVESNKTINEHKMSSSRFREIIREKYIDKVSIEGQMIHARLDIEDYNQVAKEMESFVSEYGVFENFLLSVTAESPEFNSVGDILNRYETLQNSGRECERILKMELEYASELRSEYNALVEIKTTEIKNLMNQLIVMQLRIKNAQEKRLKQEALVNKVKSFIHQHEANKVVLRGGCWDLYCAMRKRRGLKPIVPLNDLDAQLAYIKKAFQFYKETYTIAITMTREANLIHGECV